MNTTNHKTISYYHIYDIAIYDVYINYIMYKQKFVISNKIPYFKYLGNSAMF